MKTILVLMTVVMLSVTNGCTQNSDYVASNESKATTLEHLTAVQFKKLIFDYEKNKTWSFKGDIPVIIDFYADWCKPCKMLAPTLETLQKEYKGKIKIYKVDTQVERELAGAFNITGIPALLFIPKEGQPQMSTGLIPKEDLEKMIGEVLKVKK